MVTVAMAARRREEPSQELVWAEEAWKGGGERQRANLGSHGVFYRRLAKARELLLACPPHRGSRGGSLPSSPPGTHSHSQPFTVICARRRRSSVSNGTKESHTVLRTPSAADHALSTCFVLFCFLAAQALDMHVLYQAK